MRGKVLSLPISRHITCEEATLEPELPYTAQYDGELFEPKSFHAKIVHRELKMYRS